MVDGVEGERLRKGRQLRTMGGGVGGRRVRPRRAGRKYLWCERFGSDLVTGDVLRKKYIMLTNLTSYVHKGAVDFFVLRDVRSYVFGRWWGGMIPIPEKWLV